MTDTPSSTIITIGGTDYPLAPISADKALRLFDIAADAVDDIQVVWQRTESWRAEQAEANAIVITAANFEDEEVAKQLADIGVTPQTVADSGGEIRLPAPPSEVETVAYALPGAYRSLRDPMLNALAILLAPGGELLDADDAGDTDGYLAGWRRKVRTEATPDEMMDAFFTGYEYVRAELFAGDGLGKAKALAMKALGMSSPEESKPARKSSTRSRKPRAAGADESASSAPGEKPASS